MSTGNKRKAELLGMPFGTASNRLRKRILYSFAEELGRLNCYRCGEKIEKIEEFSIEHKESWAFSKDPIESFFNLENISFSHIRCNIGAAKKNKKYASVKERKHVQWGRYYAKKKEQVLSRKKDRYHKNK